MNRRVLVVGDFLAIAAITLIGFATHGEAEVSFLPRMAALYIPLTISWFLLAPWLGLFHPKVTSKPSQLWRPALAALFAAPFAAMLRGLILNAPILPIFAAILAATSALGMVVWRTIWYGIAKHA